MVVKNELNWNVPMKKLSSLMGVNHEEFIRYLINHVHPYQTIKTSDGILYINVGTQFELFEETNGVVHVRATEANLLLPKSCTVHAGSVQNLFDRVYICRFLQVFDFMTLDTEVTGTYMKDGCIRVDRDITQNCRILQENIMYTMRDDNLETRVMLLFEWLDKYRDAKTLGVVVSLLSRVLNCLSDREFERLRENLRGSGNEKLEYIMG